MDFKSKILKNIKQSENYFDGEYNFGFLSNPIGIQYAITNTVENRIIGEIKTNRFEKFSDLERLFEKFLNFFNENEYENYKRVISQKLGDESLINWTSEKVRKEKKRLFEEIYLDDIGFEWRKDFWDFENDKIIYNERYEVTLGFIDEKLRNDHSITVEINPSNFAIEHVFFE